jgi:hypothetical protein
MTIRHLKNGHWKEIIDYDTFWTLTFSVVVLGAWMFTLFSILQKNTTLP